MIKPDAAKLAWIGEDKRAFALIQNEVVIFARTKICGLEPRLAVHAEMNSEPVPTGKFKEHLFSAPCRSKQVLADQILAKRTRDRSAKNVFPRMQTKIDNVAAATGIPLFAKPFDLSEFRHR